MKNQDSNPTARAAKDKRQFTLDKSDGAPRFVLAPGEIPSAQAAELPAAPAVAHDKGHVESTSGARGRRSAGRHKRKAWDMGRRAAEPAAAAQSITEQGGPASHPGTSMAVSSRVPSPEERATLDRAAAAPLPVVQSMPSLMDAPAISSPHVLASVVSDSERAFELLPETPLPVIQAAPVAPPPPPEVPVLPAVAEAAAVQGQADPTPRAFAPTAAEATSYAPAPRQGASSGRSWVAMMLAGALVVGGALRIGDRPAPNRVASIRDGRAVATGTSRLLQSGVDRKMQRWLEDGEYVVAAAGADGRLSTSLILDDLRSKELGIAQRLARHKSAQLERPLFILARGVSSGDAPRVIDRVNPSDEQAYRDYMMSVWYCKQGALAQNREHYNSRAALHPEQTLHLMADFIRQHADSRLVDEALKDMRYVSYYALQDPAKFRNVTQALVDQSFLEDSRVSKSGAAGPELARAAAPYLKETVNQLLYQRVYRLRSGVASDDLREQI